MKDGIIRSRAQAQKRTRDIISATEARIAALKTELVESEHHVVGLSNGELGKHFGADEGTAYLFVMQAWWKTHGLRAACASQSSLPWLAQRGTF